MDHVGYAWVVWARRPVNMFMRMARATSQIILPAAGATTVAPRAGVVEQASRSGDELDEPGRLSGDHAAVDIGQRQVRHPPSVVRCLTLGHADPSHLGGCEGDPRDRGRIEAARADRDPRPGVGDGNEGHAARGVVKGIRPVRSPVSVHST